MSISIFFYIVIVVMDFLYKDKLLLIYNDSIAEYNNFIRDSECDEYYESTIQTIKYKFYNKYELLLYNILKINNLDPHSINLYMHSTNFDNKHLAKILQNIIHICNVGFYWHHYFNEILEKRIIDYWNLDRENDFVVIMNKIRLTKYNIGYEIICKYLKKKPKLKKPIYIKNINKIIKP